MSTALPQWAIAAQPIADPAAVVQAGAARFTLLTSRLVRLEYAPDGRFEDRASQPFWFRCQPVPTYEISRSESELTIKTDQLTISYRGEGPLTGDSLQIELADGSRWRCGDVDARNLRGTYRTLDQVSGATPLEPGLLSPTGWAVVDDSASLVFTADGWLAPREAAPGSQDLYFFGYGRDFAACLQDFARVSGAAPLLPRWALGNWWSRYWAYTQAELVALMGDFRAHEVPLAVCIVDMDWHVTAVRYPADAWPWRTTGWTGYSWNRKLFPDPDGFLAWLHAQGLRTALNLHPADGVWPHETAYPAVARRLGMDPERGEPVRFDIADPTFTRAYFEELHHPLEAQGVDFWWIDWQQGEQSRLPGLDPLWWLNHLHFADLARDGVKRPFIFSRWGGLGNHRYPIGFSGDTFVNWDTLAFQTYFTAAAANVGYGWWSHDIGGHMMGTEDAELYARWVQFGVFSPIFRLHSTNNPFHDRRPWGYDAETLRVARDAMQLRHALIPYLYTQSWQNHVAHRCLVRPMYHDYPDADAAYLCPQQYAFGSELIAAPFTSPADADTRLARQLVWLPPGDWFHFFSGESAGGDRWLPVYGRLDEIPVFARAGAIVPLGPRRGWGGVENPAELDVRLFAGADHVFELYEDDGETQAYRAGAYGVTRFQLAWRPQALVLTISVTRDHAAIPAERAYHLRIHGVARPDAVALTLDGAEVADVQWTHDAARETVSLAVTAVPRQAALRLTLSRDAGPLRAARDRQTETLHRMLQAFRLDSLTKMYLVGQLAALRNNPGQLAAYEPALTASQLRALLEVTQEAGLHLVPHGQQAPYLLLWSNRADGRVQYRFAQYNETVWRHGDRYRSETGALPRVRQIVPDKPWRAAAVYPDGFTVELAG